MRCHNFNTISTKWQSTQGTNLQIIENFKAALGQE